jgi:hypothetical protein
MNNDIYNYRIGTTALRHSNPPVFYTSSSLLHHKCTFASVYAITQADAEAITKSGTVTGFKGTVWSKRLWVDFDQREAADKAVAKLKEEGYGFVVYDTGNRGVHIGIDRICSPSHLLPISDKSWVRANLEGADLSLYWHLHLIRLPGTTHEQTGRKKALVSRHTGRAIELQLVREARPEQEPRTSVGDSNRSRSIFQEWSVASLLSGPGIGESRHKHLVMLAARLKELGLRVDEAEWALLEVNRGMSEPKSNDEVYSILTWAYSE